MRMMWVLMALLPGNGNRQKMQMKDSHAVGSGNHLMKRGSKKREGKGNTAYRCIIKLRSLAVIL